MHSRIWTTSESPIEPQVYAEYGWKISHMPLAVVSCRLRMASAVCVYRPTQVGAAHGTSDAYHIDQVAEVECFLANVSLLVEKAGSVHFAALNGAEDSGPVSVLLKCMS